MAHPIKELSKKILVSFKSNLNPSQKRFLKKVLSAKQQNKLKDLSTTKSNNMIKKLNRHKRQLLNNGFVERGYEDFMKLVDDTTKPKLRKLAAWELAIWHANQYTEEDAEKCLELLTIAMQDNLDPSQNEKAAIMEAECLEVLGEFEKARQTVKSAINKWGESPNLYLALANLEQDEGKKEVYINNVFESYMLKKIDILHSDIVSMFDSIKVNRIEEEKPVQKQKVTVIMPVYNSESVIETALLSVINQSWLNLEIIVVDDCSDDNTIEIVENYAKVDSRIKLIKAKTNGGPYVARNLALQVATGEFVTCHDADDWSHPEKIEMQVKHLLKNKKIIGNSSEQVRATGELKFYRRGKPGFYIFNNMSSFMFRREKVMKSIGYWDSVRFGADSEFIRRIKRVFSENSVAELETGPLSFQRQTENSLTSNDAFGYHGFFMGARKEYFEVYNAYHQQATNLRYEFPQKQRPFPIPEPMKPNSETKPSERRHFDVIIASDFRLDGGSNLSNLEEIKAQKAMGLRTGLVQMSRYDYNVWKKINPKIREIQDDYSVQMIVYGEKVSCDLLIVRYPPVLQEIQSYIPDVEARAVKVIINQTPMSDYSESGVLRYEINRCNENLMRYFGKEATWYPIGPLVRETLHNYHSDELSTISLSKEDWVNIINVDEWKRKEHHLTNGKIKIGRHSRDNKVKWPSDPNELLSIYPNSNEFEIHVLGGAETPKEVLGNLPRNWKVYDFGEKEPKEFLEGLDVFVYYTHPDWVESFGRVIIEAMATGVPVILPYFYQELFGEAAIYSAPLNVGNNVQKLMEDTEYYQKQVNRAFSYIDNHFGYGKHSSRLGRKNYYVRYKERF